MVRDVKDSGLENIENILENIQQRLDDSPRSSDFSALMVKVENIEERQKESTQSLTEIRTALYEPDKGLFSKVKEVDSTGKYTATKTDEDHNKIDIIERKIDKIQATASAVEGLQKVAGPSFHELTSVIDTKKRINKLFWGLIAGVLAVIGNAIWMIITARH